MQRIDILKNHIDKQLALNSGKNLLHRDAGSLFHFMETTPALICEISQMDASTEKILLDYLTDKAVMEFGKVNQYFTFEAHAWVALRRIYTRLFDEIRRLAAQPEQKQLQEIADSHYTRLKIWLTLTNPFAVKLYAHEGEKIPPVPCSEYSPELQIHVLGIDIHTMMEPVLDVGCGTQGKLVCYLRSKNVEAFGVDRFVEENDFLEKSDWLSYQFEIRRWGTMISHLGFSNHFHHHHLRTDGNYLGYARKYMEILASLKVGGTFYYAPGLPFIEQHVKQQQFALKTHRVGRSDYSSASITRLR